MASIHFFLIPLMLGCVLYFVNSAMQDQFINDIRASSGLIATTLTQTTPYTDEAVIINLLDEIALKGDISYIEIVRANGKNLSSPLIDNRHIHFVEDFAFDQHGDHIYFIELPLFFHDANETALLRIGFDERPLHEQIIRIISYLAIIVGSYICINLLLVFYLGKRTTRPLKKLLVASRLIREGHQETHLDIDSPVTDVRELAKDLDLMRRELISQASALQHQAMHDMLTELPNRLLLEDRIQQAILLNSRTGEPFTLLLMDLDRFKEVNDTLGHQSGDEVLRQAANRLLMVIRKTDTVARLGGDEFAILLQDAKNNAHRVAENVVREMERTFTVNEHTIRIGASIGIAHFGEQCSSEEELMRQADIAMYEAKKTGVAYKIYSASYDNEALEKLILNNDLNDAIDNDELVLHYQPKIDLATGEVHEVEALVRWHHPDKGMIAPDKFIPLAENNGLMNKLTKKLLERAIRQAAAWYHAGKPLTVSLNLSPQNLLDSHLPGQVNSLLQETGLPAQYLCLEITENAIIQKPDKAREILLELKGMGVYSVIDDFGTGYSSMIYLRNLPVNEIKIDKSFILDMLENEDNCHIVRAIIRMAHELFLTVTAEGIESEEVASQLKTLNCNKAQGFHYTKALPVEAFDQWRVQYNRNRLHAIDAPQG